MSCINPIRLVPRLFALPTEPDTAAPEETPKDAGSSEAPGRGRHPGLPTATLALIGVNVAVWLVTVAFSGAWSPANWLGFGANPLSALVLTVFGAKENDLVQRGEYWRLITPLFLHAGLLHLLFNNLALMMLGAPVERIYGARRFLILYLFAGICGSIASYEFNPGPSVGASGAILGLAGVLIVFAVRHRDRLPAGFRYQVRSVLAPQVFLILIIGFIFPGLDAMAHLGGFLGGCLLASLVESPMAGRTAMEHEKLPVGTAILTGAALVAYAAFSVGANIRHNLPLLLADEKTRMAMAADRQRAVVEREPDQSDERLKLAASLAQAGRYAEAAVQFRELLQRDPGNRELRQMLGSVLLEARQPEAAAREYREILRRNPNHAGALNDLAYTYVETLNTHYREALAMAQQAVKLRPREGTFWDTLGWACYKNGDLMEAAQAQQQAVRLSGNTAVVRYHMGAIYEAQGNRPAAATEYRAALRLDPHLAPAREALARVEVAARSPMPPSAAVPTK